MIQHEENLTVQRQCKLLDICRSGLYYAVQPFNEARLTLMHEIDREHTDHPFMGARQIARQLTLKGFVVHRSRIQRLMQVMGIYGVVPGPHTSKKHPTNPIYPYLLRDVKVTRPNQVWSTDITYIPFTKGFFYLVAIIDWNSRKVLSWRLANTLDLSFCLEALEEALRKFGTPEIFNMDQGSHFTSGPWISLLKKHDIKISMDGKGRALDNVFIERFWRTIKYEWIYLNPAEDGIALLHGIARYIVWYNTERGHSSLDGVTPETKYREVISSMDAA